MKQPGIPIVLVLVCWLVHSKHHLLLPFPITLIVFIGLKVGVGKSDLTALKKQVIWL